MISVEEAKKLLGENMPPASMVSLPLTEARGHILSEDIFSPLDVPSFDNSAMDGYALDFASFKEGMPLKVTHIVQAGDTSVPTVNLREAARIFTGAPLPAGTDTVVMQERVNVNQGEIIIEDPGLQRGDNVRLKATQTAKGTKVAGAGTKVKPGISGLLATLGLAEIKVFATPRVGIIVTGKELVKPGNPLNFGQIYESNSYTLLSALAEMYISPHMIESVDDEEEKTFLAIAKALESCDVLIITGGISVGDYDFVHTALEKAGVKKIFYKVKQKPGKPLYCGRKDDAMIFGLPGNPAAVLSCFYQYVKPCVQHMRGMKGTFDQAMYLKLSGEVTKRQGLTHFMKGKRVRDEVRVLHSQESYKMDSFLESDCLVELQEGRDEYKRGEQVRVHPLGEDFFITRENGSQG